MSTISPSIAPTVIALGAVGAAGFITMQQTQEDSNHRTQQVRVRSLPCLEGQDQKFQYVIQQLEDAECEIQDIEGFKKLVGEVFSQFPDKKVFLQDKFEQCLSKHRERLRESEYLIQKLESGACVIGEEEISKCERIVEKAYPNDPKKKAALQDKLNQCAKEARDKGFQARNNIRQNRLDSTSFPWTTLQKGADLMTFVQTAKSLLKGSENEKQMAVDAYVLQTIEEEDCTNVVDIEEFKKIVGETFKRNPEKSLFLQKHYQQCLKKIIGQNENGNK